MTNPTTRKRHALLRVTGEGTDGVVYLAEDRVASVKVAVKTLVAEATPAAHQRLAREHALLTRIQHPHLVRAVDFVPTEELDVQELDGCTPSPGPALVLEHLSGPSLAEAALTGDNALMAWTQVAHALEALHARGFVHRDLKPENVILRSPAVDAEDVAAVLADLGTAARQDLRAQGAGTPDYLAPETLAGAPPRPAADVHGLGGLLFFLTTGQAPWGELSLEESLEARRHGAPSFPENSRASPALQGVIRKLLSANPTNRPAGALAAVRLLNAELGTNFPEEVGHLSARPGLATFTGRSELLDKIDVLLDAVEKQPVDAEPTLRYLRGRPGSGRSRLLDEIEVRCRLRGLRVHRRVPTQLEARAVVLLDSTRESEPEPRPLAGTWFVAAPEREGNDRTASEDLLLGPLSEEACLEFAGRLLGLPPLEGGDSATLLGASGGLPGPLEQLVASLAEAGGIHVKEDRLVLDANAPSLHSDIEALLAARIARLTPGSATLLDLTAVFSTPITAGVLADFSRVPDTAGAFGDSLAELQHGGLIHAARDGSGGTRFEVPSPVRGAVLAGLPEARKRMLHVGAAGVLARSVPHSEGEQAKQLDAAGLDARAAPLHRKAGERLLEEGLPLDAAEHLRKAIPHVTEVGPDRARLLLSLARAEALLGDAAETVRRIEQAIAGLSDDEERARALAFAAETACHAGDPETAERACRRARRLFRRLGSLRGRAACTARLGAIALNRGDMRRAAAGCRAALIVAREEGDRSLEGQVLHNLGEVHRARGDLKEAVRHFETARSIYSELGDTAHAAKATNNLGIVHCLAGRLDDAAEAFAESVAAFRECGDRREEARTLNNRGMALWQSDRLAEAAEAFEQASGLFVSVADNSLHANTLRNHGLVSLDRGRLCEARTLLEAAAKACQDDRSLSADILLDLGDIRRTLGLLVTAREAHEQAASLMSSQSERANHELAVLAARVDEALSGTEVSAPNEPSALEQWTMDHTLRWLLEAGLLAQLRGDRDAERRHGERAHELASPGAGHHERMLAAVLMVGPCPDAEGVALLQAELSRPREGHHAEIAWRARRRLARGLASEGRSLMAGAQAELAKGLLDGLAAELDEDQRELFFAVGERQDALVELGELMSAPGGGTPARQVHVAPVLLEFVRLLNANLDVEALLPRVVDFAIELTGADRGCLILFDDGPEAVRVARSRDGEDVPRERFRHSSTIVEAVRASGKPVIVESFTDDDAIMRSASVHELRLGSASCVPLAAPAGVAGGLLGAIYVDSLSRRSGFSDREVDTLAAIAAHAATAIVNAQLLARVRTEKDSLQSEVERLRTDVATRGSSFGEVLGRSPAMSEVFATLERIAASEISVLIEGESGTGKELVAHAIHARSRRGKGAFVAVDCGSLPESLIESELFGHRKGAFTGADADRPGLFEQAGGGTIFLDEIGGTSPPLQAKLLRVLQEREVRRVGENTSRPIDVRVLAASNRELAGEVAAGRFREDLFYRLNVVSVRLPALRERPEDIPLLARHFLKSAAEREGKELEGLSPATLQLLTHHQWPGNVRQLQNVIERAVVMTLGPLLTAEDLPTSIVGRGPEAESPQDSATLPEIVNSRPSELWDALVERNEDFWNVVRKPFSNHDLTREDVLALVSRGLIQTGGSYKELTEMWGIETSKYKRFMDFLRQNRCHVDFRPYRDASRTSRESQGA